MKNRWILSIWFLFEKEPNQFNQSRHSWIQREDRSWGLHLEHRSVETCSTFWDRSNPLKLAASWTGERSFDFWIDDIYQFSCINHNTTSSTAQGGGGSFKNRKPIGEVGCCESGMAERSHWWTERCLRSPLFLSFSLCFSTFLWLSTYLTYWSIYLPIYLSICLSSYLSIYLSV